MSPRLAAIVLAAGGSRRFGDENKLLTDWQGRPMIQHVVDTVSESGVADELVVVTGYDAEAVEAALPGHRCVRNPIWDVGMGLSLAVGVSACNADGYLIVLGDMPRVTVATYQALRAVWQNRLKIPVVPGRMTPPLILPSSYRSDALKLEGDQGCRAILMSVSTYWIEVDPAELEDIDQRD